MQLAASAAAVWGKLENTSLALKRLIHRSEELLAVAQGNGVCVLYTHRSSEL